MSDANTPALELIDLGKDYGQSAAVRDISLSVCREEFLTLLGPSGSGKTTTLKMIAGFTEPSRGAIRLGERDITNVPPDKRNIGMVFQNYALFPHMTAAGNIAFPLQMRRVPRAEIARRVEEALALVQLEKYGHRYPRQLSGGQQQRVALARAVVFQPQILLMDEPLGALDKKLREELQVEILALRRRLSATVIYVTHDQEEALAMSDRIAIFNRGRIEQIGGAEDLYERPATLFVARFMGESTVLTGKVQSDIAGTWLAGSSARWPSPRAGSLAAGAEAALVIRPERLRITADPSPGEASVGATIEEIRYLGSSRKYNLRTGEGSLAVVREVAEGVQHDLHLGDRVWLAWQPDQAVLLPVDDSPTA